MPVSVTDWLLFGLDGTPIVLTVRQRGDKEG